LTSRVYARRAMELETVRRLTGLGERIETLEREGARVVKREGRNECAVVRSGDATYFVKRVRSSSALGVLADAFRGSRGKRAWRAAHALSRRGLPTPRAHALAEWGFLLPSRSALLTQSLEKAETVQEVAAKLDTVFRDRGERVRFLTSLGELVGRLHNADVDHDDLALKNILVVDPRNPRFYFIDLDAVVGWRKGLTKVRVLRALMQLDDAPRTVSRTDRMRVLAAYERTTRLHLTREDLAEIRRMLRERFARSGRDYAATGPR
jgi:tRNA A-37 threonylcarbamoyl transferase component Bud32